MTRCLVAAVCVLGGACEAPAPDAPQSTYDGPAAPSEGRRQRIEQFFDAWVSQRYFAAYDMMEPAFRKDVSREDFMAAAREHPYVELPEAAVIDHESGECFRLSLQRGGKTTVRVHTDVTDVNGHWWIEDIELYGEHDRFVFKYLRYPRERRAYAFMNAIRHRRWEAAWQLTHPFYRRYVSASAFADALANNLWLMSGGSVRLDLSESLVLSGNLANATNDVSIEVHVAEHAGEFFVTEARIAGAPTFPQPKHVRLRAEAE